MNVAINFQNVDHTQESLNAMSGPALVDLYNEVSSFIPGEDAVKRFSNKATAVRRTWNALMTAWAEGHLEPQASAEDEQPAKPERKTRGMRFQFEPLEQIRGHRENTMRARIIELLGEAGGATFEEVYAATWGQKVEQGTMDEETARKTTYEGVRLVHYYVGYGMDHDLETGKITLRTQRRC